MTRQTSVSVRGQHVHVLKQFSFQGLGVNGARTSGSSCPQELSLLRVNASRDRYFFSAIAHRGRAAKGFFESGAMERCIGSVPEAL